jgi:hypothetical protein
MVESPCARLATRLLAVVVCAAWAHPARAEEAGARQDLGQARAKSPHEAGPLATTGIDEPARYPDEAGRAIGDWVFFLPRNVIDYTFRGTELAANLIADRQLVPRYREIFGTPGADFFVFPTLFAETGSASSIGLRMIFDSEHFATSQRLGFGGIHQVEAESRLVWKAQAGTLPYVISLESYYKLQDRLEYHGVGLTPRQDERNRFQPDTPFEFGLYTERRVRGLASLGLRLTSDLELFLSSSVYRRQIRNMDSARDEAIAAVFESGSVPGMSEDNPFTWYSELAARIDTRSLRTRSSPGLLFEGYGGAGQSLTGPRVVFLRMGTRAAAYFPIYRRSNIISPRIVLDRIQPLNGLTLPFTELLRQPDFRGQDTRRDAVSLVGSLDYTWQLIPALGMRVFLDAATVAPGVTLIRREHLKNMRLAGGIGLDLFARTSTLASVGLSASQDGLRVVATVGSSSSYGDRQHRD